jgi:hypothetical protein
MSTNPYSVSNRLRNDTAENGRISGLKAQITRVRIITNNAQKDDPFFLWRTDGRVAINKLYEPKTKSNADSGIGAFGNLGGSDGRLFNGAEGEDDGGEGE